MPASHNVLRAQFGSYAPAHFACRGLIALALHDAILARAPLAVQRTMVPGVRGGGDRNEVGALQGARMAATAPSGGVTILYLT